MEARGGLSNLPNIVLVESDRARILSAAQGLAIELWRT